MVLRIIIATLVLMGTVVASGVVKGFKEKWEIEAEEAKVEAVMKAEAEEFSI